MSNKGTSDSSNPQPKPDEAASGRIELRLRSIDVVGGVPAAPPAVAPTKKPAPPDAATAAPQSLTSFDWLDTIVDEVVLASDQLAGSPVPGHGLQEPTDWRGTDLESALLVQPSGTDVLDQVLLGYSPIMDRHHGVVATRLTVVPVRSDRRLDAGALLWAVAEVWPAGTGAVSLNVASPTLLNDLLRARPNPNVMIEVPAFLAGEQENVAVLLELAARGTILLMKGRPVDELPRAVLPCFKWSIVDLAEDRRIGVAPPPGVQRSLPFIQAGVSTVAQLQNSFDRGAIAVMGWPLHDPVAPRTQARPDLQVVLEMIALIDRNESVDAIDRALVRDPVLAYELLQHVNAASPGPLRLETGSFRQAISILGRQQLRRWLASVLARTGDTVRLRPVNFAALRRGLLMRELASGAQDASARSEMFMCGVFSLLDRILGRPIGELLGALAVPDRVRRALVDHHGECFAGLELARAIESEDPQRIRVAAAAAFLSPLEINQALMRSLRVAAHLECTARSG